MQLLKGFVIHVILCADLTRFLRVWAESLELLKVSAEEAFLVVPKMCDCHLVLG